MDWITSHGTKVKEVTLFLCFMAFYFKLFHQILYNMMAIKISKFSQFLPVQFVTTPGGCNSVWYTPPAPLVTPPLALQYPFLVNSSDIAYIQKV